LSLTRYQKVLLAVLIVGTAANLWVLSVNLPTVNVNTPLGAWWWTLAFVAQVEGGAKFFQIALTTVIALLWLFQPTTRPQD
jgi:hypothetical protein